MRIRTGTGIGPRSATPATELGTVSESSFCPAVAGYMILSTLHRTTDESQIASRTRRISCCEDDFSSRFSRRSSLRAARHTAAMKTQGSRPFEKRSRCSPTRAFEPSRSIPPSKSGSRQAFRPMNFAAIPPVPDPSFGTTTLKSVHAFMKAIKPTSTVTRCWSGSNVTRRSTPPNRSSRKSPH